MAGVPGQNDFSLCRTADGRGVSCDAQGAFIGTVPLLQRYGHPVAGDIWAPRAAADLNAELSQRYGFPIDMKAKLDGLTHVAQALNRGDVFAAQLGALDMRLPDPPPASGTLPFANQSERLAMLLHGSGMLDRSAAGFASQQNAPANSNMAGGRISSPAPASQNYRTGGPDMYGRFGRNGGLPITPVQEVIPFPPMPWIETIPFPPRFMPFPPMSDQIGPLPFEKRFELRPGKRSGGNPFPEDPECEKEWYEAWKFCDKEIDNVMAGRSSGNFGTTMEQCMAGQVSERCGGNPVRRKEA
jgi:hypothetical protein